MRETTIPYKKTPPTKWGLYIKVKLFGRTFTLIDVRF